MHEASAFTQFIIPSVYFGLAIFMAHGMPLLLLCLTALGGGIALLHLFSGAFALQEPEERIGSQVLVTYGYAQDTNETNGTIMAFRKSFANLKHRIKEFHRKYIKFIAAS